MFLFKLRILVHGDGGVHRILPRISEVQRRQLRTPKNKAQYQKNKRAQKSDRA